MGAITPNLGLSPARPHHSTSHRHLNLQHFCTRRHSSIISVRASRNENQADREDLGASSPLAARRDLLLPLGAGTVYGLLGWPVLGSGSPSLAEESSLVPDCTITDKVYLEITKCPSLLVTSRDSGAISDGGGSISSTSTPISTSSSSSASTPTSSTYTSTSTSTSTSSSSSSPLRSRALSALPTPSSPSSCIDGEVLGRIVIGLYGKQVPETVANFKAMCTGKAGSSYKGSLIHRILAGQYIMAGKQGFSKEKGEVMPPSKLDRNLESIKSEAFKLQHLRPGTVSLCLSENDDEDQFKLDTDYRNVEFLITTGPGPAPQLDNKNIVFGTVLEGLDVVIAAASVPTYKPSERIRQFNEFASFLGDERASNARSIWNRPLKALYISDCGEL